MHRFKTSFGGDDSESCWTNDSNRSFEKWYRDRGILYPTNPIVSTAVYISCNQVSPGVVLHSNIQHLKIGTYSTEAPASYEEAAAQSMSLLTLAVISVHVHDDIQEGRWSKAIINTSWKPICALSLSGDFSFLASSLHALQMVKGVTLEVLAVAQACGYPMINAQLVDGQMSRAVGRQISGVKRGMMVDPQYKSSMHLDAIIGIVIALGLKKRVDMALLAVIYLLIKSLNNSFSSSSLIL